MPRAQASNPGGAYGFGERSRLRGLGMTAAGMPSATLAEEILTPGPGRVRALLSCGGNPVAALPEHRQTVEALERLDLLVQVDPWMSQTARYADFVIAPTMTPEMIGTTQKIEGSAGTYATGYGFPADYAQYCDAVVDPPAGADVIEDWLFFYGVAQRLGLALTVTTLGGERVPLDMVDPPDSADLVAVLNRGSRVPLDEIKRHPGGAFFPADPPVRVAPKEPGWAGRLDVGNAALMADLTDLAGRAEGWPPVADRFPFRLLNRRMAHVVNSSYNARVATGHPGPNHAYLCSADLAELTITAGEEIDIESPHGSIRAVAAVDDGLRRGAVSMSFGFGDGTENDEHVRVVGSSVARLLSTRDGYDPYSGQPRMSALPVRIGSIPEPGAMPTSATATPEA
jgi:anaerobic selenocysteine-containing dehydrogenase